MYKILCLDKNFRYRIIFDFLIFYRIGTIFELLALFTVDLVSLDDRNSYYMHIASWHPTLLILVYI